MAVQVERAVVAVEAVANPRKEAVAVNLVANPRIKEANLITTTANIWVKRKDKYDYA
jgi:hypothetical protein